MALLKIARMGHPVLRTPAEIVDDPTDPAVAALVDDMVETMADAGGVGLAAPQVHIPKRVVVMRIPPARLAAEDDGTDADDDAAADGTDRGDDDGELTVMINPEIKYLGDEQDYGWEACLSVPGMAGLVPRYTHIEVTYQTLAGELVTVEAKDFHARVIQHECDHIDGLLYPQRMDDMSHFGFADEIHRAHRAAAAED